MVPAVLPFNIIYLLHGGLFALICSKKRNTDNLIMMTATTNLFITALILIGLLFKCSNAYEEILNPFTNNNGGTNNNGSGCRLLIEKNEWASGCIPAVNFVVKLVDCGEGTAM